MLKKYLHEPLVHFLVLGGLLFFFYAYTNEDISTNEKVIVLSKVEIKQLTYRWNKTYLRAPTKEELQTLIDKSIYIEVMYREALNIGLDKNDLIIKRRLTQKLEFVSSDMAEFLEPSDEELLAYLSKHTDMFKLPSKIHFAQLYLNPRKHKGTLAQKIEEIQTLLNVSDTSINLTSIGDPMVFPFEDRAWTQGQIQAKLGKDFANSLFALNQTTWQGPLKSAYGLHFVKIERKVEGELPKLDKIKTVLKDAWMTEQREKHNQAFYEVLKNKYLIKIEQ